MPAASPRGDSAFAQGSCRGDGDHAAFAGNMPCSRKDHPALEFAGSAMHAAGMPAGYTKR